MLLRHVPVAKQRRLVQVLAEMDPCRDLVKPFPVELQVRRGVVYRIAAQDDERPYAARVDVGDQLAKPFRLRLFVRRKRVSVLDGSP